MIIVKGMQMSTKSIMMKRTTFMTCELTEFEKEQKNGR
jgi:hypothetical protein